jgi:hypothetical protein
VHDLALPDPWVACEKRPADRCRAQCGRTVPRLSGSASIRSDLSSPGGSGMPPGRGV